MEIPDEVLSNIFEFSGEGNHVFFSSVSKRTKTIYNEKFNKKTCYKNIISSQSRLINALDLGYKPCYRILKYVAKDVECKDKGSILNILFDNDVKWDKNSIFYAIEYNNFDYISYILSSKLDYDIYTLFCTCASLDNIEVFLFLVYMGYNYNQECIKIAAHYESKNMLTWFIEHEQDIDESFMGIMAENGYVQSIKELVNNYGISCTQDTLNCASTGSCVETIQYLLNNHNCTVTKETIYHSSCSSNPQVRDFFRQRYPELYNENILDTLARYSL